MQKITLAGILGMLLAIALPCMAGTLVLSENFDSTTVGQTPPGWGVTTAGNESATVSNIHSYSAPNSFHTVDTHNDTYTHAHKNLPASVAPPMTFVFRMYVAQADQSGATFGYATPTQQHWFLVMDNTVYYYTGGVHHMGGSVSYGEWHEMRIILNDTQNVDVYVDGSLAGSYTHAPVSEITNIFVGATGTSGANPGDVYYDDIEFYEGIVPWTPPALTLTGTQAQAELSVVGDLELRGFEVETTYNNTVATFTGVTSQHADLEWLHVEHDTAGRVILDGFFGTMPTADYTIATLGFAAAGGTGDVDINIDVSDLRGQNGDDQVKYVLDTDYTHNVVDDVTFETGPPTVDSVSITNDSVAATNDYVRDTQTVTVSASGTDTPDDSTASGLDSSGVTADLEDLGGSTTAAPTTFNYDSGNRTWTATWEVTSATCTPSDGTLTVTVSATDLAGNDATTPGSDTIMADNTAPTVGNVACTKANVPSYPSALDAEYVKNGDDVQVTATVDDTGSGAGVSVADVSQLGGDSDMPSNGGSPESPTWSLTVTNSTSEEAPKTVSVTASDIVGNTIDTAVTDTINLDNMVPSSVEGFSAYPSNEVDSTAPCDRVKLAWTTAGTDTNLAGHVIRRNAWGGTGYPEYASGDAPSYPDASEGTLVSDGSLTSPLKDAANDGLAASERSIYYYQIFAYDKAGNFSAAATSQQARSTNYQLGDFHIETNTIHNGSVDFDDLSDFSNAYRTTSGGAGWNAACDIGPTHDDSRKGIPVPDDSTDFEDLMIFAMNYATPLAAPLYEPSEFPVGMPLVVLERESTQPIGTGEAFRVALRLSPELRAKGAHLMLHFDPRFFAPVDVKQGQLGQVFFHTAQMPNHLDITVAALGTDQPLVGDTLATVEFVARGSSPNAALFLSSIDVRGVRNERSTKLDRLGQVSLNFSVGAPTDTQLFANYPNPFNPETWIPYQLSESSDVTIRIYDLSGQLVRTLDLGHQSAGYYLTRDSAAHWDGRNATGEHVASGTYILKLDAGGFTAIKRMVILK